MLLVISGQDFYNQNLYTGCRIYNGVDYDSTFHYNALQHLYVLDIKGAETLPEWLQKARSLWWCGRSWNRNLSSVTFQY